MLNTTSLPCVLRWRHNTRTLNQPVQKARKPAPQSRDRLPPAPPAGDLEKSESTQASPTEQGQTATRATRGGLGKIRKTKHSHVASGWSHIIHPCRIGLHCLEFVGLY
jgi:hypothetical protein